MGTGAQILRKLLAALMIAWSSAAFAKDVAVSAKARNLFKTGVALLEDAEGPRYEEAYRAFKAAYADSPSPRILGNVGLCAMKLERDGEALDAYQRYLAEVEDIDPQERAQIENDVRILQNGKADLELRVEPRGAVIIDERKPARGPSITNRYGPVNQDSIELRLRAGNHRIRIEHPDAGSKEMVIELAPGSRRSERVALRAEQRRPAEPPPPSTHMELAFVKRPLTLPRFTLSPALGVRYGSRALDEDTREVVGGVDLLVVSFAPIDDLQLDLWPLTLEFLPEVNYGTASAGATYRFLDEVVELGIGVELGHWLGPYNERRFFLDLSPLKALAHLGEYARLDTEFVLTFLFRDPVVIGMNVPLRLAFQPHEVFYAGFASGVGMFDFQEAAETVFIPVGAFIGVSIPRDDDPLLDIGASFDFPQLFMPGADKVVEPNSYVGALRLRLYFYL